MNVLPIPPAREEDFVLRSRERLRDRSTTLQLPKGAPLFAQGDAPAGVYFVIEGSVDVSVSARNGRRLCVCVAAPGDVLGVSSTVSGKAQDSKAEAITDCTIQFVPRDVFLESMKSEPAAHLDVVRMLSIDVGRCYDVMRALDADVRSESERRSAAEPWG